MESYDHHENKWIFFSDMVKPKSEHSVVSTANKIFAVNGCYLARSEVYDNISRKFTLFNIKPLKQL